MPVNVQKRRASIGLFQPILHLKTVSGFRDLRVVNYATVVFFVLLLLFHGNIEVDQRKIFQNYHVFNGI